MITFHSLEDRIVKTAFAELARGCTLPERISGLCLRKLAEDKDNKQKTNSCRKKMNLKITEPIVQNYE